MPTGTAVSTTTALIRPAQNATRGPTRCSPEGGHIRLGSAEVPEKLVECLNFRIPLTVNDFLVLFKRNRTFLLESDRRPLKFRQDRPRKPIHPDGKIMSAPQIDIRRDRTLLQNFQKMF